MDPRDEFAAQQERDRAAAHLTPGEVRRDDPLHESPPEKEWEAPF